MTFTTSSVIGTGVLADSVHGARGHAYRHETRGNSERQIA
jgi:hypothetical protein